MGKYSLLPVIFIILYVSTQYTFADEPSRIVSGYIAIEGEFPFVVSLRYNRAFTCGGSIISRKHILTAAHCVENREADRFIVRSGTIWREWYGLYHYVSHITQHPLFRIADQTAHGHDIAVLTLTSPITMDRMHSIIPIASRNTPAGVIAELIGWGQTKTKGPATEIQRKSHMRTISQKECQSVYGNYILDKQLCTREPSGTGACKGDSGGPLVYNNEVVGITSWVIPCAKGFPDAFTRVFSYRSFINDAMRDYP